MTANLKAQTRDHAIKSKQLRAKGFVPGTIYGKSVDSQSLQFAANDLKKLLKNNSKKIELNFNGKDYLAYIGEVQYDSLGKELLHIAFHAFDKNEKVAIKVPLIFEGKAVGQTTGGILKQQMNEVTLYGYAKDLPDELTVNISKLELGDSLHISDLPTPPNYEIKDKSDNVLVVCNYPKLQIVDEPSTQMTAPTEEVDHSSDGQPQVEPKAA